MGLLGFLVKGAIATIAVDKLAKIELPSERRAEEREHEIKIEKMRLKVAKEQQKAANKTKLKLEKERQKSSQNQASGCFCVQCGERNEHGFKYCWKCGSFLNH